MNKLSQNAIEQAALLEEALHDTFSNSRRDFLKKGSLAVLAAASLPVLGTSLSSCSEETMMPTEDSNKQDVEILTTAYVVERLAINTYNVAAGTGLLTGAFLDVAGSFINDHIGHAGTFSSVITDELKATAPLEVPDTENFTNTTRAGLLVAPSFGNLTSAAGIVKYALALELIAAKLYFDNATNTDSTKRLKSAAALNAVSDIGPIEAEHAAVFRAALKLVLATDTDADNANVGLAISPRSFISTEVPRP